MSWRAVTEADLLKKMSSTELDSLRSAGLAEGQTDPIAEQISLVVDLVRGYIAANPKNTMGAEGTLPQRLIFPALDYLVIDVSSRVAGILIDLNDTRKKAQSNAIKLFELVAKGGFAIETPTDADEAESQTCAVEQANSTTNTATRTTLADF